MSMEAWSVPKRKHACTTLRFPESGCGEQVSGRRHQWGDASAIAEDTPEAFTVILVVCCSMRHGSVGI
jgi:hypothetical protein